MLIAEIKRLLFWKKIALGLFAAFLPLLAFEGIGFLKAFELQLLDAMLVLRGPRVSNPNLILITLDDRTANTLGSPLPRQYYSQLLRALDQYGAKTIAFDIEFINQREAQSDAELSTLMQTLGHVIQPFWFYYRWTDDPAEDHEGETRDSAYVKFAVRARQDAKLNFVLADSAILPHPIFITKSAKAGLAFTFPDDGGRSRYLPLLCKNFAHIYPASSLVAVCDYLDIPTDSIQIQKNFWGYHLVIPTAETAVKIPINRKAQALLNFYGAFETFKSYSIIQILEAVQDIEQKKAPRVPLHDFAGKIVLIGTNETMKKDIFVTPFAEDFPGMGIHATAISNFLNADMLHKLPWRFNAGLALVLGAMLMLAGKITKGRETVYQWALLGAIILSFNWLAYFLLFKTFHLVAAILSINSALVLLFVSTAFYEKSLNVKTLHRKVLALEGAIAEKDSQVHALSTRINTQDEQYKAMEFFIGEMESILNNPAMARPHVIETPLMKMQIFKEHLKNELEHRRAEKQLLEAEKETLASQVSLYKGLEGSAKQEERAAPAKSPQLQHPKKFEEVSRIMESYKAFVQKAKAPFQYDPAFGMVTAVMNGQANKTKMQEILAQIARLGPYDSTVLITGDTGTGKEMVAKAIRSNSRRKDGPFVEVNCGAIPEGLIESEFFGHEKGAFSGAIAEHAGFFEQANGGTIFLDEIGELPPHLQTRLLRVLQDKKVRRVGGKKDIAVDVRVVAATRRDLQKLMQDEQFREDLYFRLDVANIHLPRLCERKDEIPPLVHYFLGKFHEKNNVQKRITDEALMAFVLHDWPGNIRELQNEVEKACINSLGETIHLADLSEEIQRDYREIFAVQQVPLWEAIEAATKTEMENLLGTGKEMLRTGSVETALQTGQLKLWGAACENCYAYMKAYIDSKGSSFPPEQREKLAKQTIVAMSELLIHWCKEQKLGPMQHNWEAIETLLGRTRRMLDNWKKEVGEPGFTPLINSHYS